MKFNMLILNMGHDNLFLKGSLYQMMIILVVFKLVDYNLHKLQPQENVSSKRHGQLQVSQVINISNMIVNGELQIGKGANQIGPLILKEEMLLLSSFEFIFILHLMFEIMGIIDILYQILQCALKIF
ncbi:hypothetical protein CR513_38303, partial [Mucuna pruriens]